LGKGSNRGGGVNLSNKNNKKRKGGEGSKKEKKKKYQNGGVYKPSTRVQASGEQLLCGGQTPRKKGGRWTREKGEGKKEGERVVS